MYAVTAWMVQPFTSQLVGLKMNIEQQNNFKTNNEIEKNHNNESNTQNVKNKGQYKLHLLKKNYNKACLLLGRLNKKRLNGTLHAKDEEDRKKYLAVVREYEEYKKMQTDNEKKATQNQGPMFPKAGKQLEISKTDKKSFQHKYSTKTNQKIEDTLLTSNQQQLNKFGKTTTRRPSLDILNDELCLAVVNEIEGYFKPVNQTDWTMINNKINEFIMNFLLNADTGIPRYSSGEVYQDYILIQCNDMFSKEFICNCMAKIRYAFNGMSLTVIPAARIPDVLRERFMFEMKVEPSPSPAHINRTEQSKNPNFDQNQGFQLSLNYFKSDFEDPMKNSCCREQIPDSKQPMPWEASFNYSESSCEDSKNSLDSKDSKNPNFDPNQGFQLSVNYFDSDIEDSMKSSICREQMPDRADCKGSLKTSNSEKQMTREASINYSDSNCEDSMKLLAKNRKHTYERNKRKLEQLSELKELTLNEMKLKLKSENFIRKYESMFLSRNRSFSPSINFGSFHESNRENRTEFSEFSMANKNSNILWNNDDSRSERFNAIKETPCRNAEGLKFSSSNRSFFEPNKEPINEFAPYQQYNEMPNNLWKYDDPNTETGKYSGFKAEPSNFNNFPQSFSQLNNENAQSIYETRVPIPFSAESPPSYSETKGILRLDSSEDSLINRNLLNQELPSFSKQFPDINQSLTRSFNFPDQSRPLYNFQCLKEPKKPILEKRINEFLNAQSEGISAKITTKESKTESVKAKDLIEPGKPSDTCPPIAQLKRKLNSVRNRISNLPVVEVISLTDDSDNSDVEDSKPIQKEMAEQECIKALEYLKNIQHREPSSLSQIERLQIEIYRHKVKKYKQIIGLEEEKGNIKTAQNNRLQSTQVEVTYRDSRVKKRRSITSQNTFPNLTFEDQPNCRVTNNSNSQQTSETTFQSSEKYRISTPNQECSLNASDSYESRIPISKSNTNLEFAIIDRNQEDLKIRTEAWFKIEQNLLEALAREMEQTRNPNIGMFQGTYWRYGIKIIQCETMESLNFIKRFIHNQHIFWPNTQFDVIPVRELPRRATVKIWIPPTPIEDKAVLRILKAQNTQFYSLDWTLMNAHERMNKDGKDFYISISATSLERLRRTNGQIRFGTNRLRMILPEEESNGS